MLRCVAKTEPLLCARGNDRLAGAGAVEWPDHVCQSVHEV
jgi:hypothetical protein